MSRGLRFTEDQYAAMVRSADRLKEPQSNNAGGSSYGRASADEQGASSNLARRQPPKGHAKAKIGPVGSPKTSKYRNKPTDGYASAREAKRAAELKLLEAAGHIRNLKEQVRFVLIHKRDGERECAYIADFTYQELVKWPGGDERWLPVVEDCKGHRTEVYRIKRKLMLQRGIRIRET